MIMNEYIYPSQNILTPDQRVRIFISSTIQELKQERKALRNAVQELKLHPVTFEGASRPHPPQKLYKAYLEQSHIYVGIFWKSYGWVAPDMKISGIEDEYNLSKGKPRLVYVKDAEDRDPQLEKLLDRIRDEGTVCYQTFSTIEELVDLIKNDVMLLLSEQFGILTPSHNSANPPVDYLEIVKSEIKQRGAINRESIIEEVKKKLVTEQVLIITGDPGIGKTFVLGALGEELNAIYISLRNKTAQQIFAHLANRLSIRRNQLPQTLLSEEEARAAFQEELANNTSVLLVDDADQNLIVARLLASLDYYSCRLVMASRSNKEFLSLGYKTCKVSGLNREEIEAFLAIHKIQLPPGEFQNLLSASQGNPLYLYYFSQHQVSPPPIGLEEYQQVLWQQILPKQQELMKLISFSIDLLDIVDLHTLLNMKQSITSMIMETKKLLDDTFPLIRQVEEFYEFFHPYFEEFVRSEANSTNLSSYYHSLLGEYAISKDWGVSVAYHLLQANDSRVKGYLLNAAHTALLRGDWLLAEEFLNSKIELLKDGSNKHDEAQAHHLLSQVCQELGKHHLAQKEAQLAIKIYDELGEAESKEMTEIWSCTLLIEEGRATETIEILKKALNFYRDKDDLKEAYIQLNLSFSYLQISLFQEGSIAAQRALELFTKLDDERGIHCSILNLAGCIGALGNLELQRKYAEQIIDIANKKNLLRLKAGGLNHLAIAQRRNKEYLNAQKTLEECIEICQILGMTDVEALNIGNLGNVFRDQKMLDKAEAAYLESLDKARQHKFIRHEARALELIAHVKFDRGFYEEAIALGNEALKLHQQIGEHLRIASTLDYLARSYLKLDRKENSAKSDEESGKHYEACGQLDDAAYAYNQAASTWNTLDNLERATFCISQGLRCSLQGEYPECASNVLEEALQFKNDKKYGEFYFQTLQLYLKQDTPFASFMYNFSAYCKQQTDLNERKYYSSSLHFFINTLTNKPSSNVLNALAVALEQATPEILPLAEFEKLIEQVVSKVEHLHYRSASEWNKTWTIGLNWKQPIIVQVSTLDEDYIIQRMAMLISLVLLANQDKFEQGVTTFSNNLEKDFTLNLMMEKTFSEATGIKYNPLPTDKEFPASFTASGISWDKPQPPTYIILDDTYEIVADWSKHPKNKALVWVLMNIYGLFVAHCIHKYRDDVSELARMGREFCEEVLKV